MECKHKKDNWMFSNGFYCGECSTFFPDDTITYIRIHGIQQLWMVFHNLGVKFSRKELFMTDELFQKLEVAKEELWNDRKWSHMKDSNLLILYNEYLLLLKEFDATKKDCLIPLKQNQ
jgi:hypothetical protein